MNLPQFCFLLITFMVALVPPCCHAQGKAPDPRIIKILSDWEKRQNNLAAIKYEIQGELVTPKGTATDDFGKLLVPATPSMDISCPLKGVYLFHFSSGRFRIEISQQRYSSTAQQFYPSVKNVAFNGSVVKVAAPREANSNAIHSPPPEAPDVAIFTGNLRGFQFEREYYPLFFAHGIVPTAEQQIATGRFKEKLNANYLHVHGRSVHAGRSCLVVRTETLQLATSSFEEFWVDEARESAVVRYSSFSGNYPFTDTVIEYAKSARGWLPKGWTHTNFNRSGAHLQWRMRVENMTLEPSFADSDFDIEIEPGMRVQRIDFPESSNPLFLPEPKITVFQQGHSATEVLKGLGQGNPWRWIILVAMLSLFGASVAWYYNRRRRAHA
jgi:hypothetical protein